MKTKVKMTLARKKALAANKPGPDPVTQATPDKSATPTDITQTLPVKTEPEPPKPATQPSVQPVAQPDPVAALAAAANARLGKREDRAFKIIRNHTLEDDAYQWANNPTVLPNVPYSPMQFIGRRGLKALSDAVNRLLKLDEVKFLVQTDGKMETCWITGQTFYPVKYVPFVSREAIVDLSQGIPLIKCRHYFGGAFTLLYGRILATSGSVYEPNGEDHCDGSPLVIAEGIFAEDNKKHGSKRSEAWPQCRQQIIDFIEKKTGRVSNIKSLKTTARDALAAMRNSREPVNLNNALAALTLDTGSKPPTGNGSH